MTKRSLSWVLLLAFAGRATAQEVTAGVRGGVYEDDDHTQVVRTLANVAAALSKWHISANEAVDIVSSASIDVRTSPHIDAMTSASQVSMSDRRFETTLGVSHDDGRGHVLGFSLVHAIERDYQSVGGGLSLSWDVASRNTTLLASVSANHNMVGSIFDDRFSATLDTLGYSLGVAQVISPHAALRLRYDGSVADGYQASPYRAVRFGNWSVSRARENGMLTFQNAVASLDEKVPEDRLRHALVGEWVQSLGKSVGLVTQLRLGTDSWGVKSLTAGADARIAVADGTQLQLGYRYFTQKGADFFRDKYTEAPAMYTYYTSDKELGDEHGHLGSLALRFSPDKTIHFDARVDLFHYTYPGFILIGSRNSVLAEAGLRIDF